jgi:predicted nuclease of restriction endonuclease-like (RecB) superfamily
MKGLAVGTKEYQQFVSELKERVLTARLSAARAVNHDLIMLYWDIGKGIVERQQTLGWGKSVVNDLSRDLREAFSGQQGFSPRSLWYMRCFFAEYSKPEFLRQALAELQAKRTGPGNTGPDNDRFLRQLVAESPWGHHLTILNKVIAPAARIYYLRASTQFGWSRNVLLNQIKAGAYERAVKEKKTHNFPTVLPASLADQAEEMLKSSYNLEVEFALKSKTNPIGVAEYQLRPRLPKELKGKLPTAKQLSDAIRPVLPETKN